MRSTSRRDSLNHGHGTRALPPDRPNGVALDSLPSRFEDCIPDWTQIWSSCARRVATWRTPPHWSPADWHDEVRAHALAAAWQAVHDFQQARGVPSGAFVRRRILSSVLSRFRQEWSYATHRELIPEDQTSASSPEKISAFEERQVALQAAVSQLSEAERRLIEQLFWDQSTEREIGDRLGITQSAVSQRKRTTLLSLRRSLKSTGLDLE
jgi:RNA polymerase sigma factor (sigma-70 family)